MLEAATAVTLGLIAAGGIAAVVLVAIGRDPDLDDEHTAAELLAGIGDEPHAPAADQIPDWTLGLRLVAAACPVCGGRHCAGCDEPARHTATWRRHVARHCQDEIPPSILVPALLMPVVDRARELTRQVGRGRPALDLRTRVALAPTAWAARLGRPVQLAGCTPRQEVTLP
jgi:hypothetical protein